MVALPRHDPDTTKSAPPTAVGPVSALFLAWRRVLSRALRGAQTGATVALRSRVARAVVLTWRYLRDPAGTLAGADETDRTLLKESGALALALGVALSFAVPAPIGEPLVRRFLAAGWMAGWALARLFVMRAFGSGALRARPRSVDDAWGPALLPYVAAVAQPLPLIALAASAYLTLRGFDGLGVAPREARRAVAVAFGGQIAVELLAWLARGGAMLALLGAR